METTRINREVLDKISAKLADDGRLIEGGWLALKHLTIPRDASDDDVKDKRRIFFAGAQHLYASIMSILEPGSDATNNDLSRMALIDTELRNFYKEVMSDLD